MKIKFLSILLVVVLTLGLAGCGSSGETAQEGTASQAESGEVSKEQEVTAETAEGQETEEGFRTITDHAGNEVTIPKEINRIVVADIYPMPSVLSVFFDSAEKIVGMADVSMSAAKNGLLGELYPEILDAKTDFIDGTSINVEELMALEPDVVFYSAGSTQIKDQLDQAEIPAVGISTSKWGYDCIETLNQWISLLDEMFEGNEKAELVSAYSDAAYADVQSRVAELSEEEKARIFFLFQYSDTNMVTSGKNFFGQWWCDAIGGINVGEELTDDNSVPVNMEQVYAWDPDTIFITNFTDAQPEDLYNNTIGSNDWSEVTAVLDQSVYKMPLGIYRSYTPGVDTPITLYWLAKTTYPELFEDIDIIEETKSYYKEIFGIELTTQQAEQIFAPEGGTAMN